MLKLYSFRPALKYMISTQAPKLLCKKKLLLSLLLLLLFFAQCKNEWKEHKCWRQKDQKRDFYKNKKSFKTNVIDPNKILVRKEKLYGINVSINFFIGYSDNDAIRPLWIVLPQMIGYAKHFKVMPFKISDNKLLKIIAK